MHCERLHSLSNEALNGTEGTLGDYDAERERWPFALRDGGVEFVSAAAALAL